ncbi:MAG: DNA-binding domain-containing protein [Planctomycetota bacterium]
MPYNEQPQLDVIQRWMQAVIVHPDGVAAGIESAAAQSEVKVSADQVDEVIDRSNSQSSIERLEVYAKAYRARLLEVLVGEYPALVHAIGEEVFVELANGYLEAHPPGSYTLAALGQYFPGYLAKSRPARDDEQPDWADFLIDLAHLERIYSEVFDGPGIEQITAISADDIQGLSVEAWLHSKLIPAPCLRLATFDFPVHEYATDVRCERQPAPPQAQMMHLAITRRDFIVRRVGLSEPEFKVLSALIARQTISEALESLLQTTGQPAAEITDDVRRWFHNWTVARYFVGIRSSQ